MQETTNYKFKKPDVTDNVNINDINTNMDVIDEEIKRNVDSLASKVDKVEGKGLSANDFTDVEKSKLEGIQARAEINRPISDSVTLDDSTISASSKAVKIVFDKASQNASKINSITQNINKNIYDIKKNADKIGVLDNLTTTDNGNLVAAVNEIKNEIIKENTLDNMTVEEIIISSLF